MKTTATLVLLVLAAGWTAAETDPAAVCLDAAEHKNFDAMIDPCTEAAESGHARAQSLLGLMYQYGYNVRENDVKAVKLYMRAAKQGDDVGQFRLALMYDNGEGVPENDEQARKWYTKVARQGYAKAQTTLGIMYDTGDGVPQDKAKALEWFTKAAEQGQAEAQLGLGWLYFEGEAVEKDTVPAYMWLNLAAAQGDMVAARVKELVRREMTTEQVTEAQRLSTEWFEKHQAKQKAD